MGQYERWGLKYPVTINDERLKAFKKLGIKMITTKSIFDKHINNSENPAVYIKQKQIHNIEVVASNITWKTNFVKTMKKVKIPIQKRSIY